ncbi:aldehyde dehydrogenase, dimeric NADP-preferring isoform X2 [Aethina tumida]|uniref:aldehyde dehydrogenase, dimeric NADP-preferring isoform X2 n=1 Tax=Aethina tumida TaxID=116153 RepID=UPI00214815A4|nr:aldehyde dehydrogenase, dimeric NADP-preferring isoform X2 [Aethina tumida]
MKLAQTNNAVFVRNNNPAVINVTTEPTNPSELVAISRKVFGSRKTLDVQFRKSQLNALIKFLDENRKEIVKALNEDLRKHVQEAVGTEIEPVLNDCRHTIFDLDSWARPKKQEKRIINLLDTVYNYSDPYGTVLIIGAWNYPLLLTLNPLIGALAAGNCVILKPSELSPHTAELLSRLLPKYLDPEVVQVTLGGIPETNELLKERFDYIFFTGSTAVGKIVYKAAAEHLTPVTLELGGKSPVYLDNTGNMEQAARRILWGRFLNSGQTCVSPDYILCTAEVQNEFIEASKKVLETFYGPNPLLAPDLSKIVTERHFNRLLNLIQSEKVAIGGVYDKANRLIAPTILRDVSPNDPVMQEEIFGPILPILVVKNVDEAIDYINVRDKPLALYIFSKNKDVQNKILKFTSAGGVAINDTVSHLITENIPFGGVGASGMGAYHGKEGFDTFSHKKGVLIKDVSSLTDFGLEMRYPPYSEKKTSMMNFLLKKRKGINIDRLQNFIIFIFGMLFAYLIMYLKKIN